MGRTLLLGEEAEYQDMLIVCQVSCSAERQVVSNVVKIEIVLMCE